MGSLQRQRDLALSCCKPALPSKVQYMLPMFTPAGKPPVTEAVCPSGAREHTQHGIPLLVFHPEPATKKVAISSL